MSKPKRKEYLLALVCISLLLLLNACKVTQTYRLPDKTTNDRLFRDTAQGDSVNNIATVSWKEFFTDTSLQSLIQEGINNNLDLKIAMARIKSAAANVRQSKLQLLPAVDAGAGATFQRVTPTQFAFPEAYSLQISASWEADIWGKLGSAKRAAIASLLQSDAYRRSVQTQLVSDIVTNYYLLLAYEEQLHITERTVDNRVEEIGVMKLLKESNVVTGAAVVQSEANRYSVAITIPDLKQNIRETENTLSILLGKAPDTIYRSSLREQVVRNNLAIGIPAQLLANRPDVQQAEFQLRNSFEMVNVARSYFYPSLTITGATGFSATSFPQLLNPVNFFAYVTGQLLQPIFSQGRNKQRLTIAQANQEEYLNAFRKTILVAGQEVSNALFSYKSAEEKQSLRKEQIAYLEKSVDYTKELLKYSSATNYTDVLTSEQSLLSAQLANINDKLQQLIAMVNLYRSLGGGWR